MDATLYNSNVGGLGNDYASHEVVKAGASGHFTTTTSKNQATKTNGGGSKGSRLNSRAKTPWTTEENSNLFKAMAEYIYVDKKGMKPLAIYLNPTELDHVEACEADDSMSDEEIAESLFEQSVDNNPNRRGDLLFFVLRHLQRASGGHSTRVVNEKVKNVRSRIINLFMSMYSDGVLPVKRPARYVAAILGSLASSPFFPSSTLDPSTASIIYGMSENKHDVCLWLQAMFWLYPKAMYEFVCQCALQIVRVQAEQVPHARRTAGEHNVLSSAPEFRAIIRQMYLLVDFLNSGGVIKKIKRGARAVAEIEANIGVADLDSGNEDEADYENSAAAGTSGPLMNKRKRRGDMLHDSKKARGQNISVVTNDGVTVSLAMFDLLKTEEKLQVAGMKLRLMAAVGGIIRNNQVAMLDIKYHLYRLWTCISRLSDVAQMMQNPTILCGDVNVVQQNAAFAEFVVVKYFSGPFEPSNIEPRVRVSKERTYCPGSLQSIEALVEQVFASSEGEMRPEIPIWLTIARRSDGKYVLALVISSPEIDVPLENGVSAFYNRHYSDQMIASAIDGAIGSGGNTMMGMLPIQSHSGMDPWPWMPGQPQTISVDAGFIGHIPLMTDNNETLVVATLNGRPASKISPWHEPRLMTEVVFERQQTYANLGITGTSPSYSRLLQTSAGDLATGANTGAAVTRNHSPLLQPSDLPYAAGLDNSQLAAFVDQQHQQFAGGSFMSPTFEAQSYGGDSHHLHPHRPDQQHHHHHSASTPSLSASNHAIMAAAAVANSSSLSLLQPQDAGGLLLSPQLPPQHQDQAAMPPPFFPNNMLESYPQNAWGPTGMAFDTGNTYPQFFETFDTTEYPL